MPEGHTIHRLARRHKRLFAGAPVRASSPQGRFEAGAAAIDGLVLRRTDAHGKHLFHDYGDRWLHVHLGLYGTFTDGAGDPPAPRGQIRLLLTGGRLRRGVLAPAWAELRGPTACEVLDDPARDALLARLGPDPLRADADPALAWERIGRSRTSIGALLMRQDVLSGVGNVYRAEALFRAGIDPYRAGRDLTVDEWNAVWDDLVVLMADGVRLGRILTLRPEDKKRATDPIGSGPQRDRGVGRYVYHRTGRPCRICGTPVQTSVVEARNLYWCPVCQK
ncbi:Fpg/Nei family DNA glycosylase [Cryptosporangium minutisporangium]|uniref:DNA-(apurinic or apyrimidinic site) lyase n=1 Tax=Cryptosporangium minutisporangium TaxID=113569 RepID=A0ABP6T7K9_9ACTN